MSKRSASQERWLNFWNTVLYNALAPFYDSLDWLTFGAWWKLVRRALEFVPPEQNVLEVGFGPGKLHVELAKEANFCVGLDLASGMCSFAQRRLLRQGLEVNITRGNALSLPYADESFDTVVSTFALSGMPDGQNVVREMARVLRTGGQIILVDIGLPSDGNRFGRFWAKLWESMGDYLYNQVEMIEMAGLSLTKFEEFGPGKHIRVIVATK